MRILFVGGGTGGHFYPLIAVAEVILASAKQQKLVLPELYYMGPEPYDQGSLFSLGITFVRCPAGKLRLYGSLQNITDTLKTVGGFFVALWKLFSIYPDVILSKGGYASVPVVLAAWLLRIPIVVHESDTVPGRANVLGARLATYVAISYPDTARLYPEHKTALTGIPIRRELLADAPANPHTTLNLAGDRPLIFIVGGSQGSERINDLVISSLGELLAQYEVLHQVGERNATVVPETAKALVNDPEKLAHYHVRPFLDVQSLHAAYTAASLVISRAGSTSIHEIALHGAPAILIPIPEEISRDQRSNAYAYARTHAAYVIEERNMTPHLLVSEITRIMGDQALRAQMRSAALAFAPRDAAEKIAQMLVSIGLEH